MNKRQTVWLITRLIGVYFGYWAIVSLLSLVGAIYAYTSLPSPNNTTSKPQQTIQVNGISIPTTAPKANQSPNTPGVENPADKAKSDALKEVLWQFFFTAIYGGIGFYLIRNGKLLFSTLIREDLTDDAEEIISTSSPAKPKEQTVTTLDLSPSPSSKKEEVTSLNLSEYVPKSQQPAPIIEEKVEEVSTEIAPEQLQSEIPTPETKPILADEATAQMDYSLPTVENNQTDAPVDVSSELPNQPFFADETPTLISQNDLLEILEPPKPRTRQKKIKPEIADPTEEQPNESILPSDVLAKPPFEEPK